MPIKYFVDRDLDVIFETWEGVIIAAELKSYWRHVYLADPEVIRCRRTLCDLRLCDMQFTGAELNHLVATFVIPKLGTLRWRTAILTKSPVHFGVARQYAVFAEIYSNDVIFDDRQKALDWLLQKRPDDP